MMCSAHGYPLSLMEQETVNHLVAKLSLYTIILGNGMQTQGTPLALYIDTMISRTRVNGLRVPTLALLFVELNRKHDY